MRDECTIELFMDGRWHEAAHVTLFSPPEQGWKAKTYTGYTTEWAVDHARERDAHALASQFAVTLQARQLNHWPVFLIDMLPQGHGREELLRQLKLPETMAEAADWRLLVAGAGNPIGHLRVKEAAQWLMQRTGERLGFTDEEVAARSDDFMEYLGANGLFVAGSSGVQGEWPKALLTRARDGLLYLDHTVADTDALEHFIVKFGRGANLRLAQILRHEAAYMDIAAHLGLKVHAPLKLRERALFVPRFDRRVVEGSTVRLAQESIATLTGLAGFGVVPSHDEVCRKLASVVSDPQRDILEYIKRDVANLALGNKDNHARNTALQRDFDGTIALSPLFDFAPMYLHPDGIARRIRWEHEDPHRPDWTLVVDEVCEQCKLDRKPLVDGLKAMQEPLENIARDGDAWGLEPDVHDFLRPGILQQVRALSALV